MKASRSKLESRTGHALPIEVRDSDHTRVWAQAHSERTRERFGKTTRYTRIRDSLHERLSAGKSGRRLWIGAERYRLNTDDGPGRSRIERHTGDGTWKPVVDLRSWSIPESSRWVIRTVLPAPQERPTRILVQVSSCGQDRASMLEVDLDTGAPVPAELGGFRLEDTLGGLQWVNSHEVLAFVALNTDELTHTGHPRRLRWWHRGTDLNDAPVVAEASKNDLTITAQISPMGRVLVRHHRVQGPDRYELLDSCWKASTPVLLPAGTFATLGEDGLYLALSTDWFRQEQFVPAGSLLFLPCSEIGSGISLDDSASSATSEVIFRGTPARRIRNVIPHGRTVYATVLDDGLERVIVATRQRNGWKVLEPNPPVDGSARLCLSSDEAPGPQVTWSNLTQPPLNQPLAPAALAANSNTARPSARGRFQRHHARSSDGQEVTYFLATPPGNSTGPTPTLVLVYGGFGASLIPQYAPELDHGWMAHGGAIVIAQIRGGGEQGAKWHQAGKGLGKLAAVEDLQAVISSLYSMGFTDSEHLACLGVSNGGLLTMLFTVIYPKLLGAAVVNNALLDLTLYNSTARGRAWEDEYGIQDGRPSPDLYRISPFHLLADDHGPLPPVLITAERNDDRVDPTHSRKMVHRLQSLGHTAWYLEGEGNHRGSASLEAGVEKLALSFEFLWHTIGG